MYQESYFGEGFEMEKCYGIFGHIVSWICLLRLPRALTDMRTWTMMKLPLHALGWPMLYGQPGLCKICNLPIISLSPSVFWHGSSFQAQVPYAAGIWMFEVFALHILHVSGSACSAAAFFRIIFELPATNFGSFYCVFTLYWVV
ncbi:hypothetical protein MA16_Dca021617 [Dendrobium catenatum]|uniref:Uncharacterized protein n=1 Tax=Dendrobium catenatum TaxID=906689 RepID=A0A2I0W3P1_9ASPA|nr:hypothetical protein MA16_Dca021617 [Dendrobium catenatum]